MMQAEIQRSRSRLFQFCPYIFSYSQINVSNQIITHQSGAREKLHTLHREEGRYGGVNGDQQEVNPAMIICTLMTLSTLLTLFMVKNTAYPIV